MGETNFHGMDLIEMSIILAIVVKLIQFNKISPLFWWKGLRGTCELADFAIWILGAPITSAPTESSLAPLAGFTVRKETYCKLNYW